MTATDAGVKCADGTLPPVFDDAATVRTTTKDPATQRRYQDVVNTIADVENRMHQLRIVVGQVFGTKAWTSIDADTRLGLGTFMRAELQTSRQRLEHARSELLHQVQALDALLDNDGEGPS